MNWNSHVANIHASCVVLGRAGETFGAPREAGILLLGGSGAGKSDMALRLIAQGALLVADDRCELSANDDAVWARAPRELAGLIEIRGVGIAGLPFASEARVSLAVQLVEPRAVIRLPERQRYEPPPSLGASEGVWPPLIALAPFEESAPAKVVAAAALFAAQREGVKSR
jgi:serine kinase of HPr protein (carbohydrate metabolism regulator)